MKEATGQEDNTSIIRQMITKQIIISKLKKEFKIVEDIILGNDKILCFVSNKKLQNYLDKNSSICISYKGLVPIYFLFSDSKFPNGLEMILQSNLCDDKGNINVNFYDCSFGNQVKISNLNGDTYFSCSEYQLRSEDDDTFNFIVSSKNIMLEDEDFWSYDNYGSNMNAWFTSVGNGRITFVDSKLKGNNLVIEGNGITMLDSDVESKNMLIYSTKLDRVNSLIVGSNVEIRETEVNPRQFRNILADNFIYNDGNFEEVSLLEGKNCTEDKKRKILKQN